MKKIISVLLVAVLLVFMVSCDSTSTEITTYNGITKTVTTTTKGGSVETEIVYTDEDGNTLGAEEGAAAFEAAQAEVEGTEETDTDAAASEGEGTEAGDQTYTASLAIVNGMGADITELYLGLEGDDWGENLLDGATLASGEQGSIDVTYTFETAFELGIVTGDTNGELVEFHNFGLADADDPENITLTITLEDDGYYIAIQ